MWITRLSTRLYDKIPDSEDIVIRCVIFSITEIYIQNCQRFIFLYTREGRGGHHECEIVVVRAPGRVKDFSDNDVIMGAIAFQITSLPIVYPTLYSDADQRIHQSSAWLAFVWGIHRGPVNSPHKWPVTRTMFPFDDVIMEGATVAALTSHECHGVPDHRELDSLFDSLFRLPTRKTPNCTAFTLLLCLPKQTPNRTHDKSIILRIYCMATLMINGSESINMQTMEYWWVYLHAALRKHLWQRCNSTYSHALLFNGVMKIGYGISVSRNAPCR